MKAYVIGRAGHHRNFELISRLESNFDEVVEANGFVSVDPTNFQSLVNAELFRAVHRRDALSGEVGCGLAHIAAWRWLTNSNEAELAVFEDDAQLDVDDLHGFLLAIQRLHGPWYLTLQTLRTDQLLTQLVPIGPKIRRARVQPRGTVAYVISREAAVLGVRDFEEHGQLLEGTSDRWPGPAGLFKFYVAVPAVVSANDFGHSYIGWRNQPPEPWGQRLGRLLRLLVSPSIPRYKKRGLLILKLLRAIKFGFSVFFATEWYRVRWGKNRGTQHG